MNNLYQKDSSDKIWHDFNNKYSSLNNIIKIEELNKYPNYKKFITDNLFFFLNNEKVKCLKNFTKILYNSGIKDFNLEIYLKLLSISINEVERSENKSKLIIGLGTGRCGSTSLSYLLSMQKDTFSFHEHPPIISWSNDTHIVDFHIKRFNILLNYFDYVIDIAHWWLPYVEKIININPESIFVCLKRDKMQTVSSFLKIKGNGQKGTINHWINHDNKFWRYNVWDKTYPKFVANNIDDAISQYWENYYLISSEIEKKYPKNFKIFYTKDLSTKEGQLNILNFCGYNEPLTNLNIKKNVGTVKDGAFELNELFKIFNER